jgi:hypothetical protein
MNLIMFDAHLAADSPTLFGKCGKGRFQVFGVSTSQDFKVWSPVKIKSAGPRLYGLTIGGTETSKLLKP